MRNRIAKYRKPLGLSQHRLAKQVGVTRVTINYIETEKRVPNLKLANNIARTLGVCMYEIFDLDGSGNYVCEDCNCHKD